MANRSLFASMLGRLPKANAVNEAGGLAYKLEPKHALAQVAATGTFGNAFYSTAETQLDEVLKLIDEVDDNQYLAKLALYAREKAFMKDMPAALLVALSVRDTELMHRVLDRVVDNGRVLRTVFQMIRSGQFKNKAGKGRVGLSSSVQRAFQRWLNTASVGKLLSASIGNDPSLRDILRMARPTPKDNARRAMFGWLTDKSIEKWAPATEADLPVEVQSLIAYRNSESEEAQALIAGGLDNVRWDLLSDAANGPQVWAALARKMGPQALRMNLNTLLRHDVLATSAMVDYVADRIADESEIRRSKQLPYQYFAAYLNADDNVPQKIKTALHKAAEIACGNVPELPGPVKNYEVRSSKFEIRRGKSSNFELLISNFIDSVRYFGIRCQDGSKRFDLEHRRAAGKVRWWWNRLFAATGRLFSHCEKKQSQSTKMNSESRRFYAVGVLAYLGLLFAGIVIVLGVLQLGNQWGMVEATSTETHAVTKSSSSVDVVFHVLLTLAAVIFLGAIFGRLCRYFGQPPVIGEVIAGLSLGPSLLGAISPDAMHLLIPSQVLDPKSAVATSLKVIAQLGVILYMFLVGLELNAAQLKHKAHAAVAISHASIVVPFTLGTILSLWLYPMLSDRDVPFVSFALFLGVAMSITAFPVLARILTDRNLQNTPVGTVALSCAAADDVTAWCLLSLVVGIAKSEVGNAAFVVGGALAFILIVFFVARPLLVRYVRFMDQSESGLHPYAIVVVYVMILGAAALTEWIGIHAIFGAFLLGVIMPSDSSIAKSFQSKLKEPVTVLLLPAFFAYTGMRTEIGLLNDWSQWLVCLVIIFVATLGKFGGTLLAARYAGESWREAGILGMLMNTRGLMELIVLNIGLDLGVISPTLFAMMVIMALVTTITTAPALQFLSPPVRTQHGH